MNQEVLTDERQEQIKKVVKYFFAMCKYADELNIYEWDDADQDMQAMKKWVEENFKGYLPWENR